MNGDTISSSCLGFVPPASIVLLLFVTNHHDFALFFRFCSRRVFFSVVAFFLCDEIRDVLFRLLTRNVLKTTPSRADARRRAGRLTSLGLLSSAHEASNHCCTGVSLSEKKAVHVIHRGSE